MATFSRRWCNGVIALCTFWRIDNTNHFHNDVVTFYIQPPKTQNDSHKKNRDVMLVYVIVVSQSAANQTVSLPLNSVKVMHA